MIVFKIETNKKKNTMLSKQMGFQLGPAPKFTNRASRWLSTTPAARTAPPRWTDHCRSLSPHPLPGEEPGAKNGATHWDTKYGTM